MPFFSVIIPSYNRASILPRAIQSVLNQSFSDWELLIVDDGSSDNTFETIKHHTIDNRIHYYKQENKGVCAARNYGAEKASGKYLLFLDSDDYVTTDWLQDFYIEVQKSDAEVVCCNAKTNSTEVVDYEAFLAGNFTVKKDLFLKIGKYDVNIKFGENTELKWRLEAEIPSMVYITKTNFFYDNEANSNSNQKKENQIAFTYYVLEKHSSLFQNKKKWTQLLYQIAGVNCIKLGRIKEGKQLLWKGYCSKPLNLKAFLRVIKYI